jgi:hypothetical protein
MRVWLLLLVGCGRIGFDPVGRTAADASESCTGDLCVIECTDRCSCESPDCIVRCPGPCEVSDCVLEHCVVQCADNHLATYDGTNATCPM